MRIFILNPNFRTVKQPLMNVRERQPLSLAIIASILMEQGHEINFFDANVYSEPVEKTVARIKRYQPEALILTSSPIDRWECPNLDLTAVFSLINLLDLPKIIITGSHGTVDPKWLFNKSRVDIIVQGEPELIVKEVINCLVNRQPLNGVKGIAYREKDKIHYQDKAERIMNLDLLPLPAYQLLPMEKYHNSGYPDPFTIIMTSRGCPFNCIFCLKAMLPQYYVSRSLENVAKEIDLLVSKFKIKSIYFQDWEFMIDGKRVEQLCDLIIQAGYQIQWGVNARANDIVRLQHLLPKMKSAGCKQINLGLESADDQVLKNINKQLVQADFQQAIDLLKENCLDAGYYMLLNCPGESKITIKNTVNFLLKNDLQVKKINFCIPYPSTELFSQLKQQLPDKNLSWDNIADYAGKVRTQMPPFLAKFYFRHYKYSQKYGLIYLIKIGFWRNFFKHQL